ncbi:MAG TPA: transglycosylase SLT domain-containing protein [Burkholderiaceae bacterium]|nr:transglycosylase SLT domain-containing protein [Burkholderiaceae bacterium]
MRSTNVFATVLDVEGWRTAGRDVIDGFVSSARLCVGFVGLATLAGALALVGLPPARTALVGLLPEAAARPLGGHAGDLLVAPAQPADAVAAVDPNAAPDEASDDADSDDVQLDGRMTRVATYLARRYRVADEAVREVVAAAKSAGEDNRVDPLLVLAVVAVESGLNPVAQSPMGARGLMQVMTSVHSELVAEQGGDAAALDPVANIKVGTAILGALIRRGGSVDRGLQLYVGAGLNGDGSGYAARVRAELQRLRMAAAGRVEAALVAAATPLRVDMHNAPAAAEAVARADIAPRS